MRSPLLALLLALSLAPAAPGQTLAPRNGDLRAGTALPQPLPLLPSPAPITPASSSAQAGQCRLACAQTYYFCLASEAPDDCPSAWTQCRVGCGGA